MEHQRTRAAMQAVRELGMSKGLGGTYHTTRDGFEVVYHTTINLWSVTRLDKSGLPAWPDAVVGFYHVAAHALAAVSAA